MCIFTFLFVYFLLVLQPPAPHRRVLLVPLCTVGRMEAVDTHWQKIELVML